MANLDRDEYIPVWLPNWLPDEVLEEVYTGILMATQSPGNGLPEESDPTDGYIIHDWFGPFLLSPPTRFFRGRC
jgi:hypothetical protein